MKFKYAYIVLGFLVCLMGLIPSPSVSSDIDTGKSQVTFDTFAVYLSDTSHAAGHIRQLIAITENPNNATERALSIEKYQVAMVLAPYCKDSSQLLSYL